MINLTTNYNLTNSINRVIKWKVEKIVDNAHEEASDPPAVLIVQVKVYTEGSRPWPTSPLMLYVRDSGTSEILIADSTSPTLLRELRIVPQTLSGTPYTTLTTAMYAATGKNNMRQAVEDLLVSVGAIPSVLAGT